MEQIVAETNGEYLTSRTILLIASGIILLISATAGIWISLGISRGLSKGVSLAQAVAIGDLGKEISTNTNDEIKDLIDAMSQMTANLRVTANIAEQVSNGDLTVEPKPLSDKDTLGHSLERMVQRLRDVVSDALSASENVSAGSQQLSSASEQVSQGATEQPQPPRKLLPRWRKWPPTSSRTPTTPHRRKKSRVSHRKMPKQAVRR